MASHRAAPSVQATPASRGRASSYALGVPTCPSCAAPAGPTGRTALLGGTGLIEMARWSCTGPVGHWWDEFRVIVDLP